MRPIRAQKTGFCAALDNVGEVGAGYAGTRRRLLPNGLYELPLFDDINGTNGSKRWTRTPRCRISL